MPTARDLVFVMVLAVLLPLYDQFVEWPMFQRWFHEGRPRARQVVYWITMVKEWALVGIGVALLQRAGGPWSAVGLRAPMGWRLWASLVLFLALAVAYASSAIKVARTDGAKTELRQKLESVAPILPHSNPELGWFLPTCLTAGVCEEFLFRGYFIWALAPWLGWWGAAVVGVPVFGLLHAYQGKAGVLRTGAVAALLTLVVAGTRSLLPAMVLHTLVDIGSGAIGWLALKDAPPTPSASTVTQP